MNKNTQNNWEKMKAIGLLTAARKQQMQILDSSPAASKVLRILENYYSKDESNVSEQGGSGSDEKKTK